MSSGPSAETLSADDLSVGDVVEVQIGPVAHGGHCVARYQGRVVFVRLALPEERCLVRLTEVRSGSFCRGEVVETVTASPDRIPAPCAHFGPGLCGGCDWQHATPERQRALKAAVVAEQLQRLAGVAWSGPVETLPGDGFGWRTRVRWAMDRRGRIGPRAVRSHDVISVSLAQPCLIAPLELTAAAVVADPPPSARSSAASRAPSSRGRSRQRRGPVADLPEVVLARPARGPVAAVWAGQTAPTIPEVAVGREFAVAADGFWQAHVAAADVLADAVRSALTEFDLSGGTAWDLYGGVGLFAAVLAPLTGPAGAVVTVEGDATASGLAADNLADLSWASALCGSVETAVGDLPGRPAAVVLDPPRSGAGPAVCAAIAGGGPDVIVYVACDPAALGRDTSALRDAGYRLDGLRAFDCYPQTHHVECVARFVPAQ